ncbi:Membrane-associated phospholipid phosphatase [Actinopolymorpha cephalotaxi]|uniref:Membrane-associated phospholipid phosphatase n=1 Tax=Actinopolymorpha cephalotaxi TaxID=504797 RepID=A0A1I2ZFE1_9ACTN|nr:phosphatase PAP2 family protein [Actinopolymorpha cephalotaxi]NYH81962.1 membrane-associated phospholipid phosphatase [Actinopolymorpha cephalotaxi]SFH36602.1 Membrane-associated phospholipid phosphatase [Actinopolymorpha cephalotaxi]
MHGRVSEPHRDESRRDDGSREESPDAELATTPSRTDEIVRPAPRFPVLAAVLLVGVVAILLDLARGGPLLRLDEVVAHIWKFKGPYEYSYADKVDRIGQRLICLPLLFGVAYYLSRRIRSIRPLVIAVGATLGLNFTIGVVKLASGRESPRTGGPALFTGDNVLFPSGHTANVIFVYGLVVALLVRYGEVRRRLRWLLIGLVAAAEVLMVVISVYRHTHWFSDLIAGTMVGAAVLQLSLLADLHWNEVRRWLRRLAGPTWVAVEWTVGLIRPRVVPPAKAVARRVHTGSTDPRLSGSRPDARSEVRPEVRRAARTGVRGDAPTRTRAEVRPDVRPERRGSVRPDERPDPAEAGTSSTGRPD